MPSQENPREVYIKQRKKRRRKIVGKRILRTVFALLLIGVVCFGALRAVKWNKDRKAQQMEEQLRKERYDTVQDIKMPDWVEEQFLDFHGSARSGKLLVGVNNIVIHYIGNPGTSAEGNRNYFNQPSTEVSAHFIVGLHGEIVQCLPLNERSAASNDRNPDTISIEVCHPDESGKFSDVTYQALTKLTAWLCDELKLETQSIIRHYDVTQKRCPRYYVDNPKAWEQLKKDVQAKRVN